MDSEKSQKESCSLKAGTCSFTALREKLILVSPHKQGVQYLFMELPDISVFPTLTTNERFDPYRHEWSEKTLHGTWRIEHSYLSRDLRRS